MKFEDLKDAAEKLVDKEIMDAGIEVVAERLREIRNLKKALGKAEKQLVKLLEKPVEDVVEI